MAKFDKYRGIDLFAQEIISLISSRKKETVEEIEKHMYDADLVEYIYGKYKSNFSNDFSKNSIYDVRFFNQTFLDMSSYVNGNESRKYGIVNEDDGLLLLVSIIIVFLKCPTE